MFIRAEIVIFSVMGRFAVGLEQRRRDR